MAEAQKLHRLAALASVVHDKVLVSDFTEIHLVIDALAGRSLFTHQIPEFLRQYGQAIRDAYPELAELDTSTITDKASGREWAAKHHHLYIHTTTIEPIT